ncbi:MAG: YggS family pyridoxal phosphate-dependent enzyme [Paludibacteraceae bacterium]|nr:YggS family pyridoxal phosphate-dependent enzyme [Paludibacteraceae bacterium]
MTMIAENLRSIRGRLPQGVELVCVSKYHAVSQIKEAYDVGERVFGESHVQELLLKHQQLPDDVKWHFIGHLQTNKVRQIIPFVSLIHSVDSVRLMDEINRQAEKIGRVVDCLVEVRVAQEETKYGFLPGEVCEVLNESAVQQYPYIRFRGLMCMASNTDDVNRVVSDFNVLNDLFASLKHTTFSQSPAFDIRSMGMSGDWPLAVMHGSNMVRIGTAIFGERDYAR